MKFSKSSKQDVSGGLSSYFDSLPLKRFSEQSKKIIVECKISRMTFYNWRYGRCRIPELHKDKIEEILETKIFNR